MLFEYDGCSIKTIKYEENNLAEELKYSEEFDE